MHYQIYIYIYYSHTMADLEIKAKRIVDFP